MIYTLLATFDSVQRHNSSRCIILKKYYFNLEILMVKNTVSEIINVAKHELQ